MLENCMSRPIVDQTKSQPTPPEMSSLDDEIRNILCAVETETVPDRLLQLAMELQDALVQRRERQSPN